LPYGTRFGAASSISTKRLLALNPGCRFASRRPLYESYGSKPLQGGLLALLSKMCGCVASKRAKKTDL